jgi:hypothetical protein
MRSSGGCWRTLQGIAEFALVQSCLSTAAKWGIDKLGALRGLLTGQTWLPPALDPPDPANLPRSHHAAEAWCLATGEHVIQVTRAAGR